LRCSRVSARQRTDRTFAPRSDRHRQLRVRGGERGLYRITMRLLHLHGRRLRPQPRPDHGLRAEPLCLGDDDEPPGRRPRHRGLRLQGARLRRARRHLRAAPRTSTATSPHRPPPTASPSATRSASSPAIATRPSTSTAGTSASATTTSSTPGRSPPGVPCIDARPSDNWFQRADASGVKALK
jgi:hypothetical protein